MKRKETLPPVRRTHQDVRFGGPMRCWFGHRPGQTPSDSLQFATLESAQSWITVRKAKMPSASSSRANRIVSLLLAHREPVPRSTGERPSKERSALHIARRGCDGGSDSQGGRRRHEGLLRRLRLEKKPPACGRQQQSAGKTSKVARKPVAPKNAGTVRITY
jgi:hypothetical protein